jgi:hypothetical protein
MLWHLSAGMEVFHLSDPCDPCYNNPYVRGDMSESQRGVRAAHSFQQGDIVGVYDGRLATKVRATSFCCLSMVTCDGPTPTWQLQQPVMHLMYPLQ